MKSSRDISYRGLVRSTHRNQENVVLISMWRLETRRNRRCRKFDDQWARIERRRKGGIIHSIGIVKRWLGYMSAPDLTMILVLGDRRCQINVPASRCFVAIGYQCRSHPSHELENMDRVIAMQPYGRAHVSTLRCLCLCQRRSTETLPPPPLCTTCGKPHPGVCYKATGGCFTCGSTQHKVKDCPQAKQKQNMPTDFARLPPTTGRVYATTRDQAAKTSGTITGNLYIDDRTVFVLFDTGATHSIISTTFAKKLNMNPTPLIERVIISTPMKNHMLIDHEYVNCPLRFDDRIRPANLLPINMLDFDVILGMDWLASHRATIDCYARTVIFGNVHQPEFVYHGSSPLKSVKLISAMKARTLISHGCQGFLA
ncbi:reverse transcriptase domain-containing protein, partial [Tanacetum coccineum]